MKVILEVSNEHPLHTTSEGTSLAIGTQYDIAMIGARGLSGAVVLTECGEVYADMQRPNTEEYSSLELEVDPEALHRAEQEDVALCVAALTLHPSATHEAALLSMLGHPEFE